MQTLLMVAVTEGVLFLLVYLWRTRVMYAMGYLTALRDVQFTLTGHHTISREKLSKFRLDDDEGSSLTQVRYHNPYFSWTTNAIINVLREDFLGEEDRTGVWFRERVNKSAAREGDIYLVEREKKS